MTKMLSFSVRISVIFCTMLFLSGCLKDKLTKTYTIFRPVYKSKAEVIASIKSGVSQSVKVPGKIYIYGKYIFLNEINKGVHIIDNGNPANPILSAFINIPGNIDIAVKGNTLYADMYTDLLTIDITNPLQSKLTKIISDVFPERRYANNFVPDPSMIVVDWIKKDTTVEIANDNPQWGGCTNCMFVFTSTDMSANKSTSVLGIGGSMSRFALVNDYMYAVNNNSLKVLSIINTADPVMIKTAGLGSNIETIYPFKNKLFIGSSGGLFIYDISNPSSPVRLGQFNHARACDPVVADDKYAYVTLRAGTFCQGTNNQLDVINIQNVMSPSLVKTYPMSNPHGLAKDNNLLFLCDGKDGLKVYDVSSVTNIKLLKHMKGYETYDIIAWDKRLMLVSAQGLHQFDYSDINDIKLLSSIPITH